VAQTFGKYLKTMCTSVGLLGGLGAALPIVSFFPNEAAYCFPPVGDLTPVARVGCIAIVLIIICCGYIGVGAIRGLKVCIIVSAILAITAAVIYISFALQYVLKIQTPNSFVLVSIGSKETDFARRTFTNGESAWDMVKMRGLSDDQIKKIWTPDSVRDNQLKLLFSYVIAAACWTLVFALVTALEINSGAKSQKIILS
jgi:hypothetical protein